MKKITSLLISGSLALAAAAFAAPPDEQSSPAGKGKEATSENAGAGKKHHGGGQEARAGAKSETNAANANNPEGVNNMHKQGENKAERRAARQERRKDAADKADTSASSSPAADANANANGNANDASANAATNASANEQAGGKHGRRGRNAGKGNAKAEENANANGNANMNAGANEKNAARKNAKVGKGNEGKGGKVVEKEKIRTIKEQHTTFRATPRPEKAPSVTFNANFRINGAESWQGPRYEAFRVYRPERHDQAFYRSRYHRVELIGGGWYYFNSGYWYPAWGYDPSAEYYAYDGPIYVGQRSAPPDQVIADVQAELQDMGYYTGDVDGLLGPLTRQALADYQADHGLYQTSAIDQDTLDALELS